MNPVLMLLVLPGLLSRLGSRKWLPEVQEVTGRSPGEMLPLTLYADAACLTVQLGYLERMVCCHEASFEEAWIA
ncbi:MULTISPECIES: hypothetical protein [unclassified Actinobaculum]|uniref:hypothetical protein n=1 Tax=unclassified Actinobaculum TaxID=2609299 RepID=UPI000D52A4B8|nr:MULTISPECIES: hypothetical protein [unclassified Actinobaculum]AWE41773.1 hypothetical protein DDD63_02245 [Actinobaculum sp. 313]RTE50309.1 hypothetical protein EKN07_03655 [Actinobaculum sp. 352]